MDVPLPLPRALVALLFVLPGVWLLGRTIARHVTSDRALRAVLAPGVALAAWVVAVQLVAVKSHSFVSGLVAGTLLTGVLGTGLWAWSSIGGPPGRGTGRSPSRWMVVSAIATTALVASAALGWNFFDELHPNGHMAFVSQIENGVYPPRHLIFAEVPLRYHYGFDMVCAALGAMLRLRVDHAIDAATLALWPLAWCLAWVLGERLSVRRPWLTPLCMLLGGGVGALWPDEGKTTIEALTSGVTVAGHRTNGPVVAYFFQHPWALGIPLALTALLLFAERNPRSPDVRLAGIAIALAALSIGEIVLFASLVPTLVVAEAWHQGRLDLGRAFRMLLVAVVAVVAARAMGGFFARGPGMPEQGLAFAAAWPGPRDVVTWLLLTFGLAFPLGVVGLFVLRRERLVFALLVGGSLSVVHVLRYRWSTDIQKFGTVAALALGLLASAALARLFPRPGRARAQLVRTSLAAVLVVGSVAAAISFPLAFALDLDGVPPGNKGADELAPDDLRAVGWLRRHVRRGDVVWRRRIVARGYAQWGGLPSAWTDKSVKSFGFTEERLKARKEILMGKLPRDTAPYRREGVRWVVVDDQDVEMSAIAERWVRSRAAQLTARFGAVRIYAI